MFIKSEPPTPVKKELVTPQIKKPKEVKHEAAVLVKTEPDTGPVLIDLKDLTSLGPGLNLDAAGLNDLALQVWKLHTNLFI